MEWYPPQDMNRNYIALVHVLDSDGSCRTQEDTLLRRGRHPTSEWKFAQLAVEKYHLELPPDTASGECTIGVAVYHWVSGDRLPVWDERGQRVSGDVMLLECIDYAN